MKVGLLISGGPLPGLLFTLGLPIVFLLFRKHQKPSMISILGGGNSNLTNRLVDPKSGELVDDKVALNKAKHIFDRTTEGSGEKISAEIYLLAECTSEHFQEFKKTNYPVKIGYFFKDGWTAGLPFYLFRCFYCLDFAVDYKHGFSSYLFCKSCKYKLPFKDYKRNFTS